MRENLKSELYLDVMQEDPGRLDYTRKAFHMLPKLNKPCILDIGCGEGAPTIELANLSKGHVTGVDIDEKAITKFQKKTEELGLSDRITALYMSMTQLDFPPERFDIIWAEGSIWFVGFQKGLLEWKKFIKSEGFLVVHEMCWIKPNPPSEIKRYWQKTYPGICTYLENLEMVQKCGYEPVGSFPLPEDAWWDLYYSPLQDRIQELRIKYKDETEVLAVLDKEQESVDLYRRNSAWYGSAYFLMQKP